MLRIACSLAAAAGLLLSPLARGADDALPALLARLAAAEERTAKVYDDWEYTMTIQADELDKKGVATRAEKIEMRHGHANGEATDALVRYERDGKDVTAEEKAKHDAKVAKRHEKEKDKAKSKDAKSDDGGSDFPSPFAPKEQPRYTFTALGSDPAGAGRVRIGFAPKKAADMEMKGEAVVDSSTGRIRSMTMTPAKLPAMVQALEISMEYGNGTDDAPLLSVMKMHGEGGILFVKKRFRAVTTFTNFVAPAVAK